MKYDVVIIGSGPAGLGAAFHLTEKKSSLKILMIEKEKICSGGLLNDCKQNYTFPIGFTEEYWDEKEADHILGMAEHHLQPSFLEKTNLEKYQNRAEKVGAKLINIKQSHVGTDKSKFLINSLLDTLRNRGVEIRLKTEARSDIDHIKKKLFLSDETEVHYDKLIIAPGRKGFAYLQEAMNHL